MDNQIVSYNEVARQTRRAVDGRVVSLTPAAQDGYRSPPTRKPPLFPPQIPPNTPGQASGATEYARSINLWQSPTYPISAYHSLGL
jgi:hypothetical protein